MADRHVHATQTSLGGTLQSTVYFTLSPVFDVLHLHQDLYGSNEAAREARVQLLEFEQVGLSE